jgi:cell division protein FtsL
MHDFRRRYGIRSPIPLPLSPFRGSRKSLSILVAAIALLVATLITGIWQKNRIDTVLQRIDQLQRERMALEVEIAQEEIEISRLSSYERIVPLAEEEIGLGVMPFDRLAFIPVPPAPPAPAPPIEGQLDMAVAAVKSAADWILPGTSTAKEPKDKD